MREERARESAKRVLAGIACGHTRVTWDCSTKRLRKARDCSHVLYAYRQACYWHAEALHDICDPSPRASNPCTHPVRTWKSGLEQPPFLIHSCSLSAIGHRPSAPRHLPSAISHQPSAISHQPSISHLSSATRHLSAALYCECHLRPQRTEAAVQVLQNRVGCSGSAVQAGQGAAPLHIRNRSRGRSAPRGQSAPPAESASARLSEHGVCTRMRVA